MKTNKLKIGDIITVTYNIEVIIPMDKETEQYIIDSDSRNAIYAIIQSDMLNPSARQTNDIMAEYELARQKARMRAKELQRQHVTKAVYHQVGQQESIDELLKIEKDINFRGWTNPDLVNKLIHIDA